MTKRKILKPIEHSDKTYFQEFYEEYKNYMYYIARQQTSVAVDCDDLVQEAVVRLMNNIPTLRKLNRYEKAKYIALTVKSAFLDGQKHIQKDNLLFLDDADLETIFIEQLADFGSEQKLETNWAIAKLQNELPARDWLVLEAKYILGLSQDEIGKLIGVAPDSVRMVLHRARKKAQSILSKDAVGGD